MRKSLLATVALLSLSLGGCSTAAVDWITSGSANFQASVQAINSDIAAVAPVVAKNCGNLQTIAGLLAQLTISSQKAAPAFAAANASIVTWCQNVPTDIASTAQATAAAVVSAQAAYKAAKAGA